MTDKQETYYMGVHKVCAFCEGTGIWPDGKHWEMPYGDVGGVSIRRDGKRTCPDCGTSGFVFVLKPIGEVFAPILRELLAEREQAVNAVVPSLLEAVQSAYQESRVSAIKAHMKASGSSIPVAKAAVDAMIATGILRKNGRGE